MAITAEGKKKTLIPMLAATICSALLVLCMFLPLFTATPDYEAELEWKDEYYDDFGRNDFDYEDLEELSFLSFIMIGDVLADEAGTDAVTIFFTILFVFYATFALLTLIFALCRKGVPVLIFTILAFLVFIFTTWIFTSADTFSKYYNLGISYYLIIVSAIGTFATSIWLIAVKSKYKVRSGPLPPAYQPMEPRYQPQYQAPQYQAPQYQAPQYQAPQYQPPQAPEAPQAPAQDPQN